MFALDLFNTDHERRLAEGAVDKLEQRRIDDLAMKMDDLVARAKDPAYKKNPAALAALMKEFQKCKAERDGYYKVRNETMGYGSLTAEAGIPGSVPTEKIPGKEDLLKGKGRTYYEGDVTPVKGGIRHHAKPGNYGGYQPEPELKGLNKTLTKNLEKGMGIEFKRAKKYQGGIEVDEAGIPGSVPTEKIPGKEDLLKGKGRSYYEADQKKNSELSDPTVDRLLTRARRDFPKARSDAEALAMKILSKEQDDVARLDRVNDREDHMIDRLADLEKNLQQQIDNLKQSAELDEHGGGIGPKQHWQDLMQENKLAVGDPIVVTGPNAYEGKTGEIDEFSPSGTFVIVNLYNHGKHSMHLSDIAYNEYADQEQDEEDDWYDEMDEGFQDFNKVEPYAVCLAGKPVKKFDYYEDARRFHDNWKKKLYNQGDKEKADKITLMPLNLDEEEQKPAGWGEFPPKQEITIVPPKKLKSGETYQDRNKYWQSQGQAPIYKTNEAEGRVDPILIKALKRMPDGLATHGQVLDAAYDAYAMEKGYLAMRGDYGVTDVYIPKLMGLYKDKHGLTFNEAKADPTGSWVVYNGSKVKRFKTHSGAKAYAEKAGGKVASSEHYHDKIQKSGVGEAIVASGPSKPLDDRAVRKLVWDTMKINADTGDQAIQRALSVLAKKPQSRMVQDLQDKFQSLADRLAQGVLEGQTDYQKRRQRERDVDAGKPVSRQPKNPQTDYAKKRAQDKKNMELGENQDTSGVERAILNRIMTAHTDLLMKFGPEKVMQAAEEVAYNVGDVDEIGTSDVSAYVAQVKQILGVPEELDEKWSQKYKSSINCANPKGFSQKAHCAGKKK